MSQLDLKQTQQWLMTVLASPNGMQNGLQQANTAFQISEKEALVHSGGANRLTRLSVYSNSYLLRLQQCLEADFPALLDMMGDELFRFFASAYIWNKPSSSTTLYDLGKGFANFLEQTQANNVDQADSSLQLPLELARLERKRTEVTRAKGLEQQNPINTFGFGPMAHMFMPNLRIKAASSLRLIKLSYPLIEFIRAIDLGSEKPDIPQPKQSFVAITRVEYRVSMRYIEAWQFYFLEAAERHHSVNACAEYAAQQSDKGKDEILQELMFWLPLSSELGMTVISEHSV